MSPWRAPPRGGCRRQAKGARARVTPAPPVKQARVGRGRESCAAFARVFSDKLPEKPGHPPPLGIRARAADPKAPNICGRFLPGGVEVSGDPQPSIAGGCERMHSLVERSCEPATWRASVDAARVSGACGSVGPAKGGKKAEEVRRRSPAPPSDRLSRPGGIGSNPMAAPRSHPQPRRCSSTSPNRPSDYLAPHWPHTFPQHTTIRGRPVRHLNLAFKRSRALSRVVANRRKWPGTDF